MPSIYSNIGFHSCTCVVIVHLGFGVTTIDAGRQLAATGVETLLSAHPTAEDASVTTPSALDAAVQKSLLQGRLINNRHVKILDTQSAMHRRFLEHE